MQAAIVSEGVTEAQAKEAFKAYRQLIREGRGTEDDKLLMRSYRAISKGAQVLDLRETLKMGGLDERFQPRLAIARADQQRVTFTTGRQGGCWVYTSSTGRKGAVGPFREGLAIELLPGIYPRLDGANWLPETPGREKYSGTLSAAVPPIPAQFRPADALDGYHILWEAEWQPVAPTDPILLKRIGGYLFAVLAQWDLTELERAVLGARLS